MAGMYDTETTLQLILDKSSLVSASKGIANGFNKTISGIGESFQAGKAGKEGIYGYQGPGAGIGRAAGKIAGGLEGIGGKGGSTKGVEGILSGPILKALGPIAILAMILSEILQFIRPFIKMFSLFILILWIPVFKLLKGFLKDLPSKMDAFKQAQGEAGGGFGGVIKMIMDFIAPIFDAFLQAIITYNPISLFIGLVSFIVDILSKIDWNVIVLSIVPIIENIFESVKNIMVTIVSTIFGSDFGGKIKKVLDNIQNALFGGNIGFWERIKNVINYIGTTVFGENIWSSIKDAIDFIGALFNSDGIWKKIKEAVDFIGEKVFGKTGWENIKSLIVDAADLLLNAFIDVSKAFQEIATNIISWWNKNAGWLFGSVSAVPDISGRMQSLTTSLDSFKKTMETNNNTLSGLNYLLDTYNTNMSDAEKADAKSRSKGWDIKSYNPLQQDFISRTNGSITPFSPNDTIIGMKDFSKLKGETKIEYHPTYNIAAMTDRDELRKIFDEHDEKVRRELESALSYPTNLRG